MIQFGRVVSELGNSVSLESRTLENGTLLLGKVPHVGTKAYLHKIYAPLSNESLSDLRKILNREIPLVYCDFLHHANGLSIFSDSLALYGMRFNNKRDGDDIYQPYHLDILNVKEPIKGSGESCFYIGSYSADGSRLYIDGENGSVFRCSRNSPTPLNRWETFEEMLFKEIARIGALFGADGKKVNPLVPTTPNES